MTTRIEAVGACVEILGRGGATFISSLGSRRISESNVWKRPAYEPLPEHWRTLRVICRGGEPMDALDDAHAAENLMTSIMRVLAELGDETAKKTKLRVDHLLGALLNFRSAPEPVGGELERMVGLGRFAHAAFNACSQAALEASSGNAAPSAEHIALLLTSLTSSRHLACSKSRRAWRFHLLAMDDQLRVAEAASGSKITIGKDLLSDLQRLFALSGDLPNSNPTDHNIPAMV